ncbi:GtrA family protein [Kribbella sp. NPDC049227]|uniref:GtrA family protein n=1 Tax=Kribbella sp. NPDC049227 TaxID=3364113 RepID=UPI00370FA9C2
MLMGPRRSQARGARFNAATASIVRRLPGRLPAIVPPSLVGFIVINGLTFGVDLTLLTVLRSGLRMPLWLSITIAYGCAFGLAYVLNRAFNFRSHAPVGRQFTMYVGVVVVNYAVWILGVGAGLGALGLEYHLARIIAGLCEGVYMYCALRWLVFRRTPNADANRTTVVTAIGAEIGLGR